jgi:hypothetical protein
VDRPRISNFVSWEKHEEIILSILKVALQDLIVNPQILLSSENENNISRQLYFKIREAQRNQWKQGKRILDVYQVVYQAQNQPDEIKSHFNEVEEKIPDFQYMFKNYNEDGSDYISLSYCIECKRLGKPQKGRIFNALYVSTGILRFVSVNHSYGLNTPSGCMIGYIQNMEMDDILREVNAVASSTPIPDLHDPIPHLAQMHPQWNEQGVSELTQSLVRFASRESFELRHLWVDLRDCSSDKD